jgi:hypothetical protein
MRTGRYSFESMGYAYVGQAFLQYRKLYVSVVSDQLLTIGFELMPNGS